MLIQIIDIALTDNYLVTTIIDPRVRWTPNRKFKKHRYEIDEIWVVPYVPNYKANENEKKHAGKISVGWDFPWSIFIPRFRRAGSCRNYGAAATSLNDRKNENSPETTERNSPVYQSDGRLNRIGGGVARQIRWASG
jgi:hypothetical protein